MAKKKTSKKQVKPVVDRIDESILPQNIVSMGERVEENKNIYISQKTYKDIHKFTQNKTTNESGGMLIGYVNEEFGKTNIVICGFIEAKYCEATPTTLKFTHETWEYVHKEMDKKYPGGKIVGWIHTHPDFGIFLSEYDKFIHENFFNEDYQIAYVVDPIQSIEGFYFWINGKIERCKGFYIYDKTGVKIDISPEKEAEDTISTPDKVFSIKNIIIGILAVAVVFLFFSNISQNSEIEKLQKQQETLAESANQSLAYMQQQIASLSFEISSLKESLKKEDDKLINPGEGETAENPDNSSDGETSDDSTSQTEDSSSTTEQASQDGVTDGSGEQESSEETSETTTGGEDSNE